MVHLPLLGLTHFFFRPSGKSAVVIALVAANPFNPNSPKVLGRKLVKTTVVFTVVSLVGQWEDECKKHAPHLKVVRFHGNKKPKLNEISGADIVISTSRVKWRSYFDLDKILFHRVVHDESHMFYHTSSADSSVARSIPAARR